MGAPLVSCLLEKCPHTIFYNDSINFYRSKCTDHNTQTDMNKRVLYRCNQLIKMGTINLVRQPNMEKEIAEISRVGNKK